MLEGVLQKTNAQLIHHVDEAAIVDKNLEESIQRINTYSKLYT